MSTPKKKAGRRKVGDIVLVTLGERQYTFALVLPNPLFAFFARRYESADVADLATAIAPPAAFSVFVMKYAVTSGHWPIVGHVDQIPDGIDQAPWFFNQDALSGEVTLTQTGAEAVKPRPGQADSLEAAAVWDPAHVEDRLRDLFAGRPNRWVESMRIK